MISIIIKRSQFVIVKFLKVVLKLFLEFQHPFRQAVKMFISYDFGLCQDHLASYDNFFLILIQLRLFRLSKRRVILLGITDNHQRIGSLPLFTCSQKSLHIVNFLNNILIFLKSVEVNTTFFFLDLYDILIEVFLPIGDIIRHNKLDKTMTHFNFCEKQCQVGGILFWLRVKLWHQNVLRKLSLLCVQ